MRSQLCSDLIDLSQAGQQSIFSLRGLRTDLDRRQRCSKRDGTIRVQLTSESVLLSRHCISASFSCAQIDGLYGLMAAGPSASPENGIDFQKQSLTRTQLNDFHTGRR